MESKVTLAIAQIRHAQQSGDSGSPPLEVCGRRFECFIFLTVWRTGDYFNTPVLRIEKLSLLSHSLGFIIFTKQCNLVFQNNFRHIGFYVCSIWCLTFSSSKKSSGTLDTEPYMDNYLKSFF